MDRLIREWNSWSGNVHGLHQRMDTMRSSGNGPINHHGQVDQGNTCLPITSTTTFGICFHCMGPHTQKNIHKLDMVQRRAARYTCNRYHNISNVTEMVGHLGWEPLATRRCNMRLCMMYKISHTVVGDPWTEWLTTTKRVTRGFHAWKYYSDIQSTQHL